MRNPILLFVALCVFGSAVASAQTQTFPRFNFNVGGGFGGAFGDVGKFTGASYHGVAGGGLNFTSRLGLKAEYMYYNLGFEDKVKREQSLFDATGHLHAVTLNGFLSFPLQGRVEVYAIVGGGWYQRSVDARSQFIPEGTFCQPAWKLWGIACSNGNSGVVIPSQTLSSNTVSGGGYNAGGGFTYRVSRSTRVYLEGRYHHANTRDGHTSVFPVTVGLRW